MGFVSEGSLKVYHADRLGSVRWVTDGSGNLVARYVYEGFGKVVGQEGSETVPYRFCGLWGYRDDQDAGLLHVGARYYEVETGRWVQKDPVTEDMKSPQTLNQFSYCENNPTNFIDPYGKHEVPPLSDALVIIGGVIAGIGALLSASPLIVIGTVMVVVGGIVWIVEHTEPIWNPVYGSGQLSI